MPPVLSTVTRTLADFAPARQPYMVRRNYDREMRSALTFPLAAALAEGTFTGVVASKYFHAGPTLIAVITAAPMFGNILALLWSQLAETRPKIAFINALQFGVALCVALVGLTYFVPYESVTFGSQSLGPFSLFFDKGELAAWAFAALIIVARVLASGIVTLRSGVWRMNYPRHVRGQIVSRINGLYNAVLAVMVLVAAFWLDRQPVAYAVIYPVVAVVSLIGVVQYSRIRVRGERQMLARARLDLAAEADLPADGVLHYERRAADRRSGFLAAAGRTLSQMRVSLRLLKTDPAFREYQWWQFLLGASFMLMFPSLIHIVSDEMTDPRTQYVLAVVVLQIVPAVVGVVFLQVWAPFFDRTPLFRFRVRLGFTAMSAHALILLGALTDSLWVVAAGTFMVGVSMGGGQLAWQLGQNAFATPQNAGTYMGLHVMLTGLRGMFAPFAGVAIYHWLSNALPDAGISGVPGGRWVFLASVILCAAGTYGYWRMSRVYGDVEAETNAASLTSAKPVAAA